MADWDEFEKGAPELSDFGGKLLKAGVAYLGTIRKDGSPRVHPVTPIIGSGHLFLFMEPTSPKGHDLKRDGRYSLHSTVTDSTGSSGEFQVNGKATLVEGPQMRRLAAKHATYNVEERYTLFELQIDRVHSTVYEGGRPVRRKWTSE